MQLDESARARDSQQAHAAPRARFVVVIETDNLNVMDRSELARCLSSLADQPEITSATEVLMMDDGEAPPDVVARLSADFPWITQARPEGSGSYFARKTEGAQRSDAEIVVFADCDVQYEHGWLASILETFESSPNVRVVAGETSTYITGPYSLAFALTFLFPRFSGENSAAPTPVYWANNVAFRRDVLAEVPIPDLPSMFRGESHLHGLALRERGIVIWRQPRARGRHAVVPLREATMRYARLGLDSSRLGQVGRDASGRAFRAGMTPDTGGGPLRRVVGRLRQIKRSEPRTLWWLPIAAPFLVLLGAAFLTGRAWGALSPQSTVD